jgi:hypothetical protein
MDNREKKVGLFDYSPPEVLSPISLLSFIPAGGGRVVSRRTNRTGLGHLGYKNRPTEKTAVRKWIDKGISDAPLPNYGKRFHFEKLYSGRTGEKKHLTGEQLGFIDPKTLKKVHGAGGEIRGKHRNKKGKNWSGFVEDVKKHGVEEIVSISVEPDGKIEVHEGNHRVDAALEAGLDRIPVNIRYYGNAQDLKLPFFNMGND